MGHHALYALRTMDEIDARRYRFLRGLSLAPGGSLEAFVAYQQLDYLAGDAIRFDATIDEAMRVADSADEG